MFEFGTFAWGQGGRGGLLQAWGAQGGRLNAYKQCQRNMVLGGEHKILIDGTNVWGQLLIDGTIVWGQGGRGGVLESGTGGIGGEGITCLCCE